MTKFTMTTITVGAISAALGLAGAAAAAPNGGSNAADIVKNLQGQGYSVQLNGSVTSTLSQCIVTGVHGDSAGPIDPTQFRVVYVDISCPPSNN